MPVLPIVSKSPTWLARLCQLTSSRDDVGLRDFLEEVEHAHQRAAWHSARLRFVHQQWKLPDLSHLQWLHGQMGDSLWDGLTVSSSWTFDTVDDASELRRKLHADILIHNDSRGFFKNDPRAIELMAEPKLSWLIAAMQGSKPQVFPYLDTYRPGAFAYYQVLVMMGEVPMQNEVFKEWILSNKRPMMEQFDNLDTPSLFGAP